MVPLAINFNAIAGTNQVQLFPPSINKIQSIKWWQWVLPIPPAINPLFGNNPCNIDQSGHFFYLAGTTGGEPVERTCTIPKEKAIFFPVINYFQTLDEADENFDTVEEVRNAVTENIDQAHNLQVSVDGTNIDVDNLRTQSRLFPFELGNDNIFGAPAGQYQAISDGYWVALKPLSVGEHEISFSAEGADGFSLDVTYHLIVR